MESEGMSRASVGEGGLRELCEEGLRQSGDSSLGEGER